MPTTAGRSRPTWHWREGLNTSRRYGSNRRRRRGEYVKDELLPPADQCASNHLGYIRIPSGYKAFRYPERKSADDSKVVTTLSNKLVSRVENIHHLSLTSGSPCLLGFESLRVPTKDIWSPHITHITPSFPSLKSQLQETTGCQTTNQIYCNQRSSGGLILHT